MECPNKNSFESNIEEYEGNIVKHIRNGNDSRMEAYAEEGQNRPSLGSCQNNEKGNKTKTLWIGELDKIKDEIIDENYILYCMFYEYLQDIIKIKLCKEKNSSKFSYAFIEFTNYEIANQCYNSLNGKWIPGKFQKFKMNWAKYNVTSNYMNPPNNNNGSSDRCKVDEWMTNIQVDEKGTYSLYVGDLNPRTTKEDVENLFRRLYHSVCFVKLIKNTNKNPNKIYCFIHFFNHGECVRALKEMNGYILKGSKIKVSKSNGIKGGTSGNNGTAKIGATENDKVRNENMRNNSNISNFSSHVYFGGPTNVSKVVNSSTNVVNSSNFMNSTNLMNSSNMNMKNVENGNIGMEGRTYPMMLNANAINSHTMNTNMLNANVANPTMANATMANAAIASAPMPNPAMVNTTMANAAVTNSTMANVVMANVNIANTNMINGGLVNSNGGNGTNGFPMAGMYYCYNMNKKMEKMKSPDYYFYYNNLGHQMNNMYTNAINSSLGNTYKTPFYNIGVARGTNMMQLDNFNNEIMYSAPNFTNPVAPLHYYAKDMNQENNFHMNMNKPNCLMDPMYNMNGNNYNIIRANPMNNVFDAHGNRNIYCGVNATNSTASDFNSASIDNVNNSSVATSSSNEKYITNSDQKTSKNSTMNNNNNTNNDNNNNNNINNNNNENLTNYDNNMTYTQYNNMFDNTGNEQVLNERNKDGGDTNNKHVVNNYCDKGEMIETENVAHEQNIYTGECKNMNSSYKDSNNYFVSNQY